MQAFVIKAKECVQIIRTIAGERSPVRREGKKQGVKL